MPRGASKVAAAGGRVAAQRLRLGGAAPGEAPATPQAPFLQRRLHEAVRSDLPPATWRQVPWHLRKASDWVDLELLRAGLHTEVLWPNSALDDHRSRAFVLPTHLRAWDRRRWPAMGSCGAALEMDHHPAMMTGQTAHEDESHGEASEEEKKKELKEKKEFEERKFQLEKNKERATGQELPEETEDVEDSQHFLFSLLVNQFDGAQESKDKRPTAQYDLPTAARMKQYCEAWQ
eukprot:Skav224583  [mRNA]  locus=scaffold246:236888:241897:- [translate_table: standard]